MVELGSELSSLDLQSNTLLTKLWSLVKASEPQLMFAFKTKSGIKLVIWTDSIGGKNSQGDTFDQNMLAFFLLFHVIVCCGYSSESASERRF